MLLQGFSIDIPVQNTKKIVHPEKVKLKHEVGLDGKYECALLVESSLYNGR